MNFAVKPPSLRKKPTQSTKEELPQLGCCFPFFANTPSTKLPDQPTFQRLSQPKPQRDKKIDLLVAKNRLSQAKFHLNSQAQSVHKNDKNQNQLKSIQATTNFTSLTSKVTTQRNSLRNSRAKLILQNKAKKPEQIKQESKWLALNPGGTTTQKASSQQLINQMTNIQYLSEISMIEQQCVSHGSTTLNALNFLNHYHFSEYKGHEVTPVRYMIDALNEDRIDEIRNTPNPLQKLFQKKKGTGGPPQRPKLCL